jgi:hypothetical protein
VCIKVFGCLGPLPDPVWGPSDNVFTFAATIKTHHQLCQFRGQPLTDFKTSELYLHGIWGVHSPLANMQILNLHKEVVQKIDGDFELPPQWQVDALANILFTTVEHDPTDNFRLPGASTCGAGICAACMAITGLDSPNLVHIQGFVAMIAKARAGTPERGTQCTFPRPCNKEHPPPLTLPALLLAGTAVFVLMVLVKRAAGLDMRQFNVISLPCSTTSNSTLQAASTKLPC